LSGEFLARCQYKMTSLTAVSDHLGKQIGDAVDLDGDDRHVLFSISKKQQGAREKRDSNVNSAADEEEQVFDFSPIPPTTTLRSPDTWRSCSRAIAWPNVAAFQLRYSNRGPSPRQSAQLSCTTAQRHVSHILGMLLWVAILWLMLGGFEELPGFLRSVLPNQVVDLGLKPFIVDAGGGLLRAVQNACLPGAAGFFVDCGHGRLGGGLVDHLVEVLFREAALPA
jgi:hypothetical protein